MVIKFPLYSAKTYFVTGDTEPQATTTRLMESLTTRPIQVIRPSVQSNDLPSTG